MLIPDSATAEQAVMASVTIPAPLILPAMQPGARTGVIIQCAVMPGTGALEVRSAAASSGAKTVHVTAAAAAIERKPVPQLHGDDTTSSGSSSTGGAVGAWQQDAAARPAALAALDSATGRTGLWMDPASFDCFLQLGQVFMDPDNTDVYVPAGLGALRIHPASAHLSSLSNLSSSSQGGAAGTVSSWAAALPLPADAGTVRSSSNLTSSTAEGLVSITSLLAKSMGKSQGSGTEAAKAAATPGPDCLYEVHWQASSASTAAAGAGATAAAGKVLWYLPASHAADPAAAAVGAIAAVQRALKEVPPGSAIQLQTAGSALLPWAARPPQSVTAAALSGLVKTLAREAPQLGWSSVDSDAAAGGSTAPARLVEVSGDSAADSFGLAVRSQATYAPLMLPSAAPSVLGPHHLFPLPRGSLGTLAPLPVDVGRKLGRDEVVLAVKSVGLNFRWVAVQGCG